MIAAGKLRALAVTSPKRLPELPNVPAVAETFPGFDFAGWWVLATPTGVPADHRRAGQPRDERHHEGPGGGRRGWKSVGFRPAAAAP